MVRSPICSLGFKERDSCRTGALPCWTGRSCELRFFGPDGVFLNRTGGMGEGPGEFRRRCFWAPSSVLDSLFVFDGPRLSAFDKQGRFGHRMLISRLLEVRKRRYEKMPLPNLPTGNQGVERCRRTQ